MMIFSLKQLITKLINIVKLPRLKLSHLLIGLLALLVVCVVGLWCGAHWEPALVPRGLRPLLRFREGFALRPRARDQRQRERLAASLERLNHDAEIFNCDLHGRLTETTDIVLIQVHKDIERLQYLIVSLAQVKRIHKTLLIFSHSYYDDDINRLIRSIRFAKVMQIFYPYSLQLNPDKFPGPDPEDCNGSAAGAPRDCLERDARLTEHKQHWWWKANLVFQGLDWSDTYQGMVIFIEENDYVLPDLLYMLTYARYSLAYFPSVEVISFGRPPADTLDYDLFVIDTWRPPYDRGVTFNRTTWLKIAALSSHFCFYDDYSWSYSLVHLFERFPGGFVEMAASAAPRVLSTGALASGRAGATWVAALAARAAGGGGGVFPRTVRAVLVFGPAGRARYEWRPPRGNGGWADLRDHMLCLDPLLATTTDAATDTTYFLNSLK